MCDCWNCSCQKTWDGTVGNGQQVKRIQKSSFHSGKQQSARSYICADGSVTKDQTECQTRCDHHPWRQWSLYGLKPPGWQWRWKQSNTSSAGLPEVVTVRPHMPSSSHIQWTCHRMWKIMEWEALTSICVNVRYPPSKTPVDVLP